MRRVTPVSTRRHWVLAALLVLLGGYFALFEGFGERRVPVEGEGAEKLFDCARARPEEIRVSTPRGSVDGRRRDGVWDTAAGGLAPAAFESLAESLCRLPIIERLSGDVKLAEFGLDPPMAEVGMRGGGHDARLLLGSRTPASNLMYAKFADQTGVLKIGSELASNVERVAHFAPAGAGG